MLQSFYRVVLRYFIGRHPLHTTTTSINFNNIITALRIPVITLTTLAGNTSIPSRYFAIAAELITSSLTITLITFIQYATMQTHAYMNSLLASEHNRATTVLLLVYCLVLIVNAPAFAAVCRRVYDCSQK